MTRRRWIKLWTQEWIGGTTRKELQADERSVWADFLTLAGDSPDPGKICFYPGVPLTDDQLCKALRITPELLDRARAKMLEFDKIKINQDIIHIVNWEHYQGEYERLRRWRSEKQNEKQNETPKQNCQRKHQKKRDTRPDQTRPEDINTTTTRDQDFAEITTLFEENIGGLTSLAGEELSSLYVEYPAQWIKAAIKEAVDHNKRNLSYIKAILNRWQAEGFKSSKLKPDAQRGPPKLPTAEELKRRTEKFLKGGP